MKKYTGFIFAMLMGMMASAATYYTVSTNSWPYITWSLTENGAPCNCGPNLNGSNSNMDDTLVIFHDVQIPNLEIKGQVIVKSGATLKGAWSEMEVKNGAEIVLEAGSVFQPNVKFELEGTISGSGSIITGWDFTVKSNGVINLTAPSAIIANDLHIDGVVTVQGDVTLNNGGWEIDGVLNVSQGDFSKSSGDLKVYGSLIFNGNLFDIQGDFEVENGSTVTITADTVTFVNGDIDNHENLTITAHYTSITHGNIDVKNNAHLTINSKLFLSNLEIDNHEDFVVSDSVWMYGLSFKTMNNSLTQFDGYVYGASTAGIEYQGELLVNGVMNLELWFDLEEKPQGSLTGCGLIDFNASNPWELPSGNHSINGVNTTFDYVTFLGNTGNASCSSNTVWYYEGNWSAPSTSCADEAVIMSNCTFIAPQTMGRMKVKKGVNVDVRNSATVVICGEVENEGIILVESGSTLTVLGN